MRSGSISEKKIASETVLFLYSEMQIAIAYIYLKIITFLFSENVTGNILISIEEDISLYGRTGHTGIRNDLEGERIFYEFT